MQHSSGIVKRLALLVLFAMFCGCSENPAGTAFEKDHGNGDVNGASPTASSPSGSRHTEMDVVPVIKSSVARRTTATTANPEDPFAKEPIRPHANRPISFLSSFEKSLVEAKRTHRRVLAFFTNDSYCHWCRVMQRRTLLDAEVVQLSRQYVCARVEFEGPNLRLADRFRFSAIPTSMILTDDGEKVDELTGYRPAAEYAAWLKSAVAKAVPPPKPDQSPPHAIGFSVDGENLAIWYVDWATDRWNEIGPGTHAKLMDRLQKSGARPRIEHVAHWQFPAKWEKAKNEGRLPELLVIERLHTTMGWQLLEQFALQVVSGSNIVSRQLDEEYFGSTGSSGMRPLLLVNGSRNESLAKRVIDEIQSRSVYTVPHTNIFPQGANPDAPAHVAETTATGFLTGNQTLLATVMSQHNNSADFGDPPDWLRKNNVQTKTEKLYGNENCAIALVKSHIDGGSFGIRHVLVVLLPEHDGWRFLTVTDHPIALQETLPRLCEQEFAAASQGSFPTEPRLISPPDRASLKAREEPLKWESPSGGEPVIMQLCERAASDHPGWPMFISLTASAGRSSSSIPAEFVLAHNTWRVWSVGRNGRLAVSERRSWKPNSR